MKLLLSSLLLASFCDISIWSVSSPIVIQTPDIEAKVGQAVNISCCCFTAAERMRFNWFKNQTTMKKSEVCLKNDSLKDVGFCSHLNFPNISKDDSGKYICEVSLEIPIIFECLGNGTVITVIDRGSTSEHATQTPIIIAGAVTVPLLLIALCSLCCFCGARAQATRVIYEVPHVDSEEAEMEKRSTNSSQGSSQWFQVPVYESLDYFERVQTKESE